MNTLEDTNKDTYFFDMTDNFMSPRSAFPHPYFDFDNGPVFPVESN